MTFIFMLINFCDINIYYSNNKKKKKKECETYYTYIYIKLLSYEIVCFYVPYRKMK